jgi:nickel superoxide dismutase
VYAHCDIPCGIYDPEQAHRGRVLLQDHWDCTRPATTPCSRRAASTSSRSAPSSSSTTSTSCGTDHSKPEHLEEYPDLHDNFWKATKQASKVKQSLDLAAARELLSMIDTIDEMWKATGGLEKTRVNGRPS